MAAVSSLPELTERKRTIDKHTNLATRLLGEIKARGLDQYYNTEEDLLTGQADLPVIEKLLMVSELAFQLCSTRLRPALYCFMAGLWLSIFLDISSG